MPKRPIQRMELQAKECLAELLRVGDAKAEVVIKPDSSADLVLEAEGRVFVVAVKSNAAATRVADAARQVRAYATKVGKKAIPVVVVPFMGPTGREQCERQGVGWLDLSGNAHIVAPGLHLHVEGRRNRLVTAGRPSSVFAPKSSRIARQLLLEPRRAFVQSDLARAAEVDVGLTSRVVRRLEEDGFVRRVDGEIAVASPGLLLDAWREHYDFDKHTIIKGHIAARSGEDLVSALAKGLSAHQVSYAMTGLAGAWLLSHFAGFRTVTALLDQPPATGVLDELGFREDDIGVNVWLVLPNDDAVFRGQEDRDGVTCAHPLQVYLDLVAHPERAREAAERVRQDLLRFEEK